MSSVFSVLSVLNSGAAEPKLTSEQTTFFESKIRPVLADNCYKCHSQAAEKVKGGLLLDSREGWQKGGDTGPAIVPGDVEKSLLVKAVRYKDKDLQMPPNDKKLSDQQIADLEAWVKMGAPDPRATGASAEHVYKVEMAQAKKHWAFRPVAKPAVPAINDPWVKTPIDAFILAGLKSKTLTPAQPADKVTLLRRATFDLTGLPPTQKEVQEFLEDTSTQAFETVIDRLLKSERYGERWGRHWLDLAHYADTKGRVGQNEDPRYLWSYTYRDWVIRALNEDLPYDQFLLQQIAADKLPLDDKHPLAAMGFLTLGNRFNNQVNDIIDDHIDTVFKATMALTVTCARCHDHKFDPIPTRDYYSLHGVFNSSTEPKEKPLLEGTTNSAAYQSYLRELTVTEAALEKLRDDVARDLSKQMRGKVGDYLLANHEYNQQKTKTGTNAVSRQRFMQQRSLNPNLSSAWQQFLQNRARKYDPIFAPWNEFAKLDDKEFVAKAKELSAKFYANKDAQKPINPVVARLFISPPTSLKMVAARYSVMFSEVEKKWEATMANYEAIKKVSTSTPEPSGLQDASSEELRHILYAKNSPTFIDDQRVRQFIQRDNGVRNKINQLERAVNDVKLRHPGSPARAHVLVDADKPRDSAVLIKGNPGNKGPVVPRQFLEFISFTRDDGRSRKPFKEGSGRLELAKEIASAENPLTARVIVNRVWLHHFGQGIVRTPDDFGTRSDPPTHPELLDYLASWFVENGWSLKKLHHLIMSSSAYQQSSDENPRFAQIDPDNRYLWQMNRRRLDFEALRDTILYIGGKLDLTMGGSGVRLDSEPYSLRRSVYGYVDRNNLPNMNLSFDFANPDLTTGKRDETIVPQQALFMMNSPLVVEQAKNLVKRPDFKAKPSNEEKIKLLYNLIYQHAPTEIDLQLAQDYIQGELALTSGSQIAWEYGYGEYDAVAKRVKHFVQLPIFNNNNWTTGDRMGRRMGRVNLTANGGQPGNSAQAAAIRRWAAPRDGYIAIDGMLSYETKAGDGVHGWIVSSTTGQLGAYAVNKTAVATPVARALVKKGDAIDFIVLGRGSFAWAPTIRYVDGVKAQSWDAKKDFSGALAPRQMEAWEKFAQVLFETNELTFVN
ncbi:MAG TPA: PSD1 and planctomycete cytochrome C domain-containing protein [Verrucomicrobiae bacterium]|nr:PSD1 and planctomycete cytochrome C domain-containing protein [Verrucomicrobiae bacterium]